MCKLSNIWANQKLLPSQTELREMCRRPFDKPMPPKRKSDVRCVLCAGNHLANYEGCTVYKDMQKKTSPLLRLKQYTPPAQIKHTVYTQPGVTYAQITQQNYYAPTNVEQEPLTTQPHQETSDINKN
jgi:hypothetical protein